MLNCSLALQDRLLYLQMLGTENPDSPLFGGQVFTVCPHCKVEIESDWCPTHKKVTAIKSAIRNLQVRS